jgi:hypothetical protein
LKKRSKKLLLPGCGRAGAPEFKSLLLLFFKKEVLALPDFRPEQPVSTPWQKRLGGAFDGP